MIALDVSESSVGLAASNAHTEWHTRRSARLRLEIDGVVGLGEAAPLVGYSQETLEESIDWLRALSPAQLEAVFDAAQASDLIASLDATLGAVAPPSARFALEMAALDVLGQRLGIPAWRLLCPGDLKQSVWDEPPSCRLLSVWDAQHAAIFDDLLAAGTRAFKIKIGRDPAREAERLAALLGRTALPVSVRLDANRSLGPAWQAELAPFLALAPEFVEEPCPLRELGSPRSLGFSLAFDEALTDPEEGVSGFVDSWLECRTVSALVLKPMLMGGLSRCLYWAARATTHGAEVVLSHVFDGSIAAQAYRHLSMALGSRRFASGLGEHPGLRLWSDVTAGDCSRPGLGFLGASAGFLGASAGGINS